MYSTFSGANQSSSSSINSPTTPTTPSTTTTSEYVAEPPLLHYLTSTANIKQLQHVLTTHIIINRASTTKRNDPLIKDTQNQPKCNSEESQTDMKGNKTRPKTKNEENIDDIDGNHNMDKNNSGMNGNNLSLEISPKTAEGDQHIEREDVREIDIDERLEDGTTATHIAAESGNEECLRLLLSHGADANVCSSHLSTPLHAAAAEGHKGCVEDLLEHNGDLTAVDDSGQDALYLAASHGHLDVCQALLSHDADPTHTTNTKWTALHGASNSGQAACLQLLIDHLQLQAPLPNNTSQSQPPSSPSHSQSAGSKLDEVVKMDDSNGCTLVHLAAMQDTKDCLEVLCQHAAVNLLQLDQFGRTVMEVASRACSEYLDGLDKQNERTCTVTIEVPGDPLTAAKSSESPYKVGLVKVSSEMTWSVLEEKLSGVLLAHFIEVSVGLRTRKTSRFDGGSESPESPVPFSLGLSMDSVKYFAIGMYHWAPATTNERMPFDFLTSSSAHNINTILFGWENQSQHAIGYETLISIPLLHNYLRLVEQYRSLVFYGPGGTGKTFLVHKLAHSLQQRELQHGNRCELHLVSFTPAFSRLDLLNLMIDKGCMIPEDTPCPARQTPILVLDNLGCVNFAEVFREILIAMENRGPSHCITIEMGEGRSGSYYLHPSCYIIGTMDRGRSTGLELSIQQRFRWVHLRVDAEPIRSLLQRHLLRRLVHRFNGRLPEPDDPVYRSTEWVVCVWQRLNDGLIKLGLAELTFGPSHFLACPIETNKPKAIHKWLVMLWNHVIAPAVSQAVIKGAGSENTCAEGQQKVANTALYVLMQRAVVSGCPLSGQEKERYLASFHGSNELDIKMRSEKRETRGVVPPATLDVTPATIAVQNMQFIPENQQRESDTEGTPSSAPASISGLTIEIPPEEVPPPLPATSPPRVPPSSPGLNLNHSPESNMANKSPSSEPASLNIGASQRMPSPLHQAPTQLTPSITTGPNQSTGTNITSQSSANSAALPKQNPRQRSPSPFSNIPAPTQDGSTNSKIPTPALDGSSAGPLVTTSRIKQEVFSPPKVVSPKRLRNFVGEGAMDNKGSSLELGVSKSILSSPLKFKPEKLGRNTPDRKTPDRKTPPKIERK